MLICVLLCIIFFSDIPALYDRMQFKKRLVIHWHAKYFSQKLNDFEILKNVDLWK